MLGREQGIAGEAGARAVTLSGAAGEPCDEMISPGRRLLVVGFRRSLGCREDPTGGSPKRASPQGPLFNLKKEMLQLHGKKIQQLFLEIAKWRIRRTLFQETPIRILSKMAVAQYSQFSNVKSEKIESQHPCAN